MEDSTLPPGVIHEIEGACAEVDPAQVAIHQRLTSAQRARKGFSMSQAALNAVIHRLRSSRPELSQAEAQRLVLARLYAEREAERGG